MTLPLSLDRVYAALKRLQPPAFFSSDDNSDVLKELAAIARPVARMADPIYSLIDELFPDTTLALADQWERFLRLPVRPSDPIDMRRSRIKAAIATKGGYTLELIARALAVVLDAGDDEIGFIESLGSQVDDALTITETTPAGVTIILPAAPGWQRRYAQPWPGLVDDHGITFGVTTSGPGSHEWHARLTHRPSGVSYEMSAIWPSVLRRRAHVFLGLAAQGPWVVDVWDTTGSGVLQLDEIKLMVSNDIDARSIYEFHVLRDAQLEGAPDLPRAQLLLRRKAAAHLRSVLCERSAFIVDDAHSLCDREPVG